ncbi:MAG: hypothetical protein QXJ06_00445 [Candidatus Aenigmatarchaeota archaeon]
MEKYFQESVATSELSQIEDLRIDPKKAYTLFVIVFISIAVFSILLYFLKKNQMIITKYIINEKIVNVIIYSTSFLGCFLFGFILSTIYNIEPLLNFFKIFLLISIFVLIGSFIIFLFTEGPLKSITDTTYSTYKKISQFISIQLCYIQNYGYDEKCLPKDTKKIGEYRNLVIKFEDEDFGKNSIPIAGESYRLSVFLTNINSPYEENFMINDIFNIKIIKIEGVASTSDLKYPNLQQSFTITKNNISLTLRPLEKSSQILEFRQIPVDCNGNTYFKVIVTTEQKGGGTSKFLSYPYYSFENLNKKIENEIKNFNSKTISLPGPLDVYVFSNPIIITSANSDNFYFEIKLENGLYGTALIKDLKLLIQREYVDILKCTDNYLKDIEFSHCEKEGYDICLNFNIKQIEISESDTYSIVCEAKINKEKYKEQERVSFVAIETLYYYNFKEYTSMITKNCILGGSSEISIPKQCLYPNVCLKYSCPEDYREVSDICENKNYVCCRPIYIDEACKDLTNNCASGKEVFDKIACEAIKEGVPPDIMIGIAIQESRGDHCNLLGNVKENDGGKSIGLMQVSQCPDTGDVHNINENIRCAIKKLKEKCAYSIYDVLVENVGKCNPTGFCTDNEVECIYCYNVEGVLPKKYKGWDIAIRGYNGWGGCEKEENYNYVENVKFYASKYFSYK